MSSTETFLRKPAHGLLMVIVITALAMGLCGCPYNSVYQLDDTPQIAVDTELLGNWETYMELEIGHPQKITLNLSTSDDPNQYNISCSGYFGRKNKKGVAQKDTISGVAFFSDVKQRRFVNVQLFKRTYIAEFVYENDEISFLPLSEHFTTFIIKSNLTLRRLIDYHFDTRMYPLYDETFSLQKMKRVKE